MMLYYLKHFSFHRKLNQLLYDTFNYIYVYTECPFVQIEVVQENSGQRFIYLFYLLPLLPNIIASLMLNILSHLQEGIYYKWASVKITLKFHFFLWSTLF